MKFLSVGIRLNVSVHRNSSTSRDVYKNNKSIIWNIVSSLSHYPLGVGTIRTSSRFWIARSRHRRSSHHCFFDLNLQPNDVRKVQKGLGLFGWKLLLKRKRMSTLSLWILRRQRVWFRRCRSVFRHLSWCCSCLLHSLSDSFACLRDLYCSQYCMLNTRLDCDPGDEVGCGRGLFCGVNNCRKFHALGPSTGIMPASDCCDCEWDTTSP